MPKCVVCGGTEFYAEAGFYFCKECQTQNEDIREEVLELRVDTTTRLRKIRVRQDKSVTSEQNLGWTTWEQYNFILIGLTNELIELGASVDIKMTILQLWAFYLRNVEVAFTSVKKTSVPRLARKFHRRDAEIIYGKIAQRKKNRRQSTGSGTSASSAISGALSEGSSNRDINKQKKRLIEAEYERFIQSQDSSEGDALSVMNQSLFSVQSSAGKSSGQTEDNIQFNKGARSEAAKVKVLSMKLPRLQRLKYRKKHVTTQYKIGPQVITPMKLWALIYLALRIHDERIYLADMLRYGREGHLSYYKLDHLLPPEVTLTKSETNLLHQTKELTHKGMRRAVASLAKFLDVRETRDPDFAMLLERYFTELQLPKGVMIYAERMMALSPPKMRFDAKTACFPNYEGRAMAFILVAMKILFGLDGITEYEISRVIEKINSKDTGKEFAMLPEETIEPCVMVHGGIGAEYSVNSVFAEMVAACRISACLAYQKILSGDTAVDAVESALWWLENDEFFNCGYGSVVNNEGGSLGAVGCVAWDGSSIVVGTSSGGTRGKMPGRVGDSPLMGCGTFANRNSGCSLTGHGESIIKMGLARRVVEDISGRSCEPQAALKKNLENISSLLGHRAGGIVLRIDGSWGVHYVTTSRDPMPYAVVKNGLITAASSRNVLDTRLFSFREWQRYIECRRRVLANVHFPTKLKLEPDAPGNHHLYLKFIAHMKSKSDDREKPIIKSHKHVIPQELADAMRASIERLNDIAVSEPKEIDIFGASFTPQHSYLQQLLEDPEKDMPTDLRVDFHSTKVGYMTNPESLQALAAQCDIDLQVGDTGLHFIDKIVPPFEQSNLPTIQEFNKTVRVEQPAVPKARREISSLETCEDAVEYLHHKNPGDMLIDSSKRADYDTVRKSLRRRRRDFLSEYTDDFGFDEVLPNGKLSVVNDSDSDSESVHSVSIENGNDQLANDNECIDSLGSKYNLSLSNYEKSTLSDAMTTNLARFARKKTKRNLLRDSVTGKFIAADSEKAKNISSSTRNQRKEVVNLAVADNCEDESPEIVELNLNYDFDLQDDDISILHEGSLNSSRCETSSYHFLDPHSLDEVETLFRPYTEYWMYRCNFSRVKQKNFRQLEKELPQSFRWLLSECANIVEMSEEDLYEEVCLLESYYSDILRPSDYPSTQNQYNGQEYRTKTHYNSAKKKW